MSYPHACEVDFIGDGDIVSAVTEEEISIVRTVKDDASTASKLVDGVVEACGVFFGHCCRYVS